MSRTLAEVFAMAATPDPFPVAALLRAAVAHARRGGASEADVARAAGLTPSALSRALRPGADARPSTVRAVLRVAGMRLVLAPAEAAVVTRCGCGPTLDGSALLDPSGRRCQRCPVCGRGLMDAALAATGTAPTERPATKNGGRR